MAVFITVSITDRVNDCLLNCEQHGCCRKNLPISEGNVKQDCRMDISNLKLGFGHFVNVFLMNCDPIVIMVVIDLKSLVVYLVV